jgi:hypothetical protein
MTFKQYLEEGRGGFLYHATTTIRVYKILKKNKMLGGTYDLHRMLNNKKQKRNISFTRSLKYALSGHFGNIILELDQRKLAQRYKIVPYSFFTQRGRGIPGEGVRPNDEFENQFEEAVLGDINNVDKYLTKIILNDYEEFKNYSGIELGTILKHPLLYDMKTKRFVNQ